MPRLTVSIALALAATWLSPNPMYAGQEAGPPVDQAQRAQLATCREGLTDPAARPDDRRRWAELLMSYRTPEATALVVELLGQDDLRDMQRSLCTAIADRTAATTDRLDPTFIEPLLRLLGADSEDLRTLTAQALAYFPGSDVPTRLGALASDNDAPLIKRLAAIDALAPNSHRRAVVEQLIGLLDAGVPDITNRVVTVLTPLTPQSYGDDANRWRAWWRAKSRLTEEAWLAEQFGIYRERLRSVSSDYQQFRVAAGQHQAALTSRIQSFQRELFRQSGEQRDGKLIEWLQDPLPEVKLTALAIIRSRMADEGKRPEGPLLATLLQLLKQGKPDVRVAVLEIVQNLNDPSVVEAILARLERETDLAPRQAIFRALGQLKSPAAMPAILREIGDATSATECVREAAIAIAGTPTQGAPEEQTRLAIEALNTRYSLLGENDTPLRAALLNAMAGVADKSFAGAFLGAVESDEAAVLRWAVRGLRAIGDVSKLRRLRTLTGHTDALVRIEAIEAVGELGHEEADLEPLLTRLNPAIESNSNARDAAWNGFRRFWNDRSIADRIRAAERLRDVPEREASWLQELANDLASSGGNASDLTAVLDRQATVLVALDRHAEAITTLKTLCGMASGDVAAQFDRRLRLLAATLRAGAMTDAVTLVVQMATVDNRQTAAVISTVADFLDSPTLAADAERARSVLSELRKAQADGLGDDWVQLLDRAERSLAPGAESPAPPVTTPGL